MPSHSEGDLGTLVALWLAYVGFGDVLQVNEEPVMGSDDM